MTKDQYIRALSASGNEYGSALEEFLNYYGLLGLQQATTEQLRDYCKAKGLKVEGTAL